MRTTEELERLTRGLGAVFAATALIAAMVGYPPPPAEAQVGGTCTVESDGSGSHLTIDAAVDDTECDEVLVGVGTFLENVTVTRSVTITGAGQAATLIDGSSAGRTLDVSGSTITVTGVAIINGSNSGGAGGGIYASGSTINLVESTVRNNTAKWGGGMYASSSGVTITRSTFKDNSATDNGGGYAEYSGWMNLVDSTFTGNAQTSPYSSYGGGAIHFSYGNLSLTNSTLSDNTAGGVGGAVWSSGRITVVSSTVTGNTSGFGTDVHNDWYNQFIDLTNSIIDGTCHVDPAKSSQIRSFGYNVLNGCVPTTANPNDYTGVPMLGALADNGGPTHTHALLTGSPALDLVPIASCSVAADQRGVSRPRGTACDSGSYEFNQAPTAIGETYTVDEGAALAVTAPGLVANDTDPDSDPLTAVLATPPVHHDGTFVLNSDGSFDYDHDGSETTSDSFTYTANDGAADSNVATVTISIDPVNDPPVAGADSYSIGEGETLTLPLFTQWGGFGSGDGQFKDPYGLALDPSGNVYVVDRANHRIQKFDSDGSYLSQWGTAGTGNGQFDYPYGAAVDGAGNIFVADRGNDRIQKFDSSGGYLTQWGTRGSGADQFNAPWDVAVDTSGNVYVGDFANHRVSKFDNDGGYLTHWGSHGSADGQFSWPRGVAVDAVGNVYVADSGNDRIQRFDGDGTYLAQWGTTGTGDGEFDTPTAVDVDVSGKVYVAESYNDRVQKFDSAGSYLAQWGTSGSGVGEFTTPYDVAVGESGMVYVADAGNNRISRIDPGVLRNDTDAEGDDLAAVLVSPPADHDGTFALSADGSFTYVHNGSETTSDSFAYKANDGAADSNVATVTITIGPVNDPPVVTTNTGLTVNHASTAVITTALLHATDTDNTSAELTFTIDAAPVTGTLFNGPTALGTSDTFTQEDIDIGSISYAAGSPGVVHFDFTVRDPSGAPAPAGVFAIEIVNDAPVAVADGYEVDEGAAIAAAAPGVLGNDTDLQDDDLTATLVTGPEHHVGEFALEAVGSFTYTHDGSETTSDSFTYKANDGAVDSNTATVTITVAPVDDPPVAVNDTATVSEDDPATDIPVLLNDTDVDGGPKLITEVSQPPDGEVVITGGGTGLTYEPDDDICTDPPATSTDDFTYTLNGGSEATVAMTVTCVDDLPVAVDDTATVSEDDPATDIPVLLNDTDVDGGPKLITEVSQPPDGEVVIAGGGTGLTYEPDDDFCTDPPATSTDDFTYTLNAVPTATVRMTVTCSNDAPVANPDAYEGVEGASLTVGGGLVWGGLGLGDGQFTGPFGLAVDAGNVYVAERLNNRIQKFDSSGTYLAQWGTQGSGDGQFWEPRGVAIDPAGNVYVADTRNHRIQKFDRDGVYLAQWGSQGSGNGQFNEPYWVAVDDSGNVYVADTLNYRIQKFDGTGSYVTQWVGEGPSWVEYLPWGVAVADGKVYVAFTSSANEQEVQVFDLDGSYVTQWGSLGSGNGEFMGPQGVAVDAAGYVYVADAGNHRVQKFDAAGTYVAQRGSFGTGPGQFKYPTGLGVDAAGNVFVTDRFNHRVQRLDFGVLGNDSDAEGDSLTAALVTPPAYHVGTFVLNADGSFTYTHDGSETTSDSFTYKANDGVDDSNTETVTITFTAVDDAPAAVGDTATVLEDDPATGVDVLSNDTDVDGGLMLVAEVIQPLDGGVVITGGGTGLTYEPDPDYCNDGSPTDDFTYTLNGGSTATVEMTVTCLDDAPVAVGDVGSVLEDDPASGVDVLSNDTDVDGGPMLVAGVTQPLDGAVVITGGGTGLSYEPDDDYCNDGSPTDDFTYTLNGGSTATVEMTVTCVDDAPEAVGDTATVLEDDPATSVDVLSNDTDVDGGLMLVAGVTQPLDGGVVITGSGTGLSYEPDDDYCNDGVTTDDFTYTLNGGSTATVEMTVTCLDDAPAVDSVPLVIGGADHLAVLMVDPVSGLTWVDVRNVASGGLASHVSFGSTYPGSHLEVMADPSGDPELVVLGTAASGAVRATVRDSISGAVVGRANYGNVYTGDDVEVIGSDLAVLGTRASNDAVRVQTRTVTNTVVGTAYFGNAYTGDDLEIHGGNVAVLGTKYANGNVRVRIMAPNTGDVVSSAYYGTAFVGLDLEVDGTNVLVLQQRLADGVARVQTRTPAGVKVATANYGLTPYVPVNLEISGGNPAVVGVSSVNQAVRVQTRAPDGVLVGTANFGTAYSCIDLEIVDGDAAVLGVKANGKIRHQIRSTDGTLVTTLYYN